MTEQDYKKLKKDYGEKFAQFARAKFPSISEKMSLYDHISSLFAPNKFLYDDIIAEGNVQGFVNYVMAKANVIKPLALNDEEAKDPFELMRSVGYTLYKCDTYNEMMNFESYWDSEEILCSFIDDDRTKDAHVFFAIKDGATLDGINGKKRSDFVNPKRQDEYGTSVIGIQFTKKTPSYEVK